MVNLENIKRIYLYGDTVSFRLGINGLSNLILTMFNESEVEGNLYVFFSKNHRQLKILEYDTTGIWLYQKKLYNGDFILPNYEGDKIQIDTKQLKLILNNIKLISRKTKKG